MDYLSFVKLINSMSLVFSMLSGLDFLTVFFSLKAIMELHEEKSIISEIYPSSEPKCLIPDE